MKLIILILLSFNLYAANWISHSNLKANKPEGFTFQADCERIKQESCYDIGENPASIYSEVTIQVDDLDKPTYSKIDEQSCSNEADCDAKFLALVCTQNDYEKIKNYDLLQVYCVKLAGYEQKNKLVMQVDPVKQSDHESLQVQAALKAQEEAKIAKYEKRITFGKRIIAMIAARNESKNLTVQQVITMNNTYSPIKGLLETASLVSARDMVQAIVADGVMITEGDKTALLTEINEYLATEQ